MLEIFRQAYKALFGQQLRPLSAHLDIRDLEYDLRRAASNGDEDAVNSALTKFAMVLIDEKIYVCEELSKLILDNSVVQEHMQALRAVLDRGVYVSAHSDRILRSAARNGQTEIVKLLLEHGANVRSRNDESLREAAKNGHAETVRVLIGSGAYVHANDDEAIREATQRGYTSTIQVLQDAIGDGSLRIEVAKELELRRTISLEALKLAKQRATEGGISVDQTGMAVAEDIIWDKLDPDRRGDLYSGRSASESVMRRLRSGNLTSQRY